MVFLQHNAELLQKGLAALAYSLLLADTVKGLNTVKASKENKTRAGERPAVSLFVLLAV